MLGRDALHLSLSHAVQSFTSLHSFSLHSSSLLFTPPPWALLSTHTHSQMGTAIDDLAVTATAHGESQATDLEVTRNPLCSYLLCCALLILSPLYSALLCSTLLCCFNNPWMVYVCSASSYRSSHTHHPPHLLTTWYLHTTPSRTIYPYPYCTGAPWWVRAPDRLCEDRAAAETGQEGPVPLIPHRRGGEADRTQQDSSGHSEGRPGQRETRECSTPLSPLSSTIPSHPVQPSHRPCPSSHLP